MHLGWGHIRRRATSRRRRARGQRRDHPQRPARWRANRAPVPPGQARRRRSTGRRGWR